MAISDFLKEIDDQVRLDVSSGFSVEVTDTNYVPTPDDSSITFGNLDTMTRKCKRLESCVLYVDIRNSTQLSARRMPQTLAKVYASFVSGMIAAATYFGGHVRNIIGDRVMVVFDRDKCFINAVNTAVMMNSISEYIINKRVSETMNFQCGIGIDYGQMLVTKTGIIRRGEERDAYRSLVWLGKPANIASRLTDIANKATTKFEDGVRVGYHFEALHGEDWSWYDSTYSDFIDNLTTGIGPNLKHKNDYFKSFFKTQINPQDFRYPSIMMTQAVLDGLKSDSPNEDCITNDWYTEQTVEIPEYSGKVFGGSVIYTAARNL